MEKTIKPQSGYFMVFVAFCLLAFLVFAFIGKVSFLFVPSVMVLVFVVPGFFIVEPDKAMVHLLFGSYKGTVKSDGFFWVLPFMTKKKISLRVRNFESKPLKVNDKILWHRKNLLPCV